MVCKAPRLSTPGSVFREMNGVGKSETPENAEQGDRFRTGNGEKVINVQNGTEGRFIRGAVKA